MFALSIIAAHGLARRPDDAGPFARATFGSLNPTLKLGYSRPLQQRDLPPLRQEDSSRLVTARLDDELFALAATGCADREPVGRALWRSFGAEFSRAGLLKLASDACQLATPLLLKRIIGLLEKPGGDAAALRAGMLASSLLLLTSSAQACLGLGLGLGLASPNLRGQRVGARRCILAPRRLGERAHGEQPGHEEAHAREYLVLVGGGGGARGPLELERLLHGLLRTAHVARGERGARDLRDA